MARRQSHPKEKAAYELGRQAVLLPRRAAGTSPARAATARKASASACRTCRCSASREARGRSWRPGRPTACRTASSRPCSGASTTASGRCACPEPKFASDATVALTTFLTVTGRRRALPRPGDQAMRSALVLAMLFVLALARARHCAVRSEADLHEVQAVLKRDFHARGQATMDRLVQDGVQRVCNLTPTTARRATSRRQLEADQMTTIAFPAGNLIGDWKNGERIAQSGRGLQWTDDAGRIAGGGSCYDCHQLAPQESSLRHDRPEPARVRQDARQRPRDAEATPTARSTTPRPTTCARRCRASATRAR